jgi:hypothetical protein
MTGSATGVSRLAISSRIQALMSRTQEAGTDDELMARGGSYAELYGHPSGCLSLNNRTNGQVTRPARQRASSSRWLCQPPRRNSTP